MSINRKTQNKLNKILEFNPTQIMHSDDSDFKNVAVWTIQEALEAAFAAGAASNK